jgi:hypothetical protein
MLFTGVTKMSKLRSKRGALLQALGLCGLFWAMLAASCSGPLGEPSVQNPAPGNGIFRLALEESDGIARSTAQPETDDLYYILALTHQDGTIESSAFSGPRSPDLNLKAGVWKAVVKGYISAAAAAEKPDGYGLYGEEDVTIKAGSLTVKSLSLWITGGYEGRGRLSFSFSFPAAVDTAELSFVTLMAADMAEEPEPLDLTEYIQSGSENVTAAEVLTVNSGYYRLVLRLTVTEGGKTKRITRSFKADIQDELQTAVGGSYAPEEFTEYFTSVASLHAYLSAQPANTAAAPYQAALELQLKDLRNANDPFGELFSSSYPANRYIDLDLSACTGAFVAENDPSGQAKTNRQYLVSVVLPDALEVITNRLFSYCSSLKSVVFPKNIHTIGKFAFASCTALEEIALPEGLLNLGEVPFNECTALRAISFPSTLQNMVRGLDNYLNVYSPQLKLTSVTVAGSMPLTLEGFVFKGMKDLVFSVTGDTGVSSYSVRDNGKTLVQADSEGKITIIAGPGFSGDLIIPADVKAVSGHAYAGNTAITRVDASGASSLAGIGSYAFDGCTGITAMDLSGTKLAVLERGVSNGAGIKTLILPETLDSVPASDFIPQGLESLVIPASIGAACFPNGRVFTGTTALTFTVKPGSGPANYQTFDGGKVLLSGDGTRLITGRLYEGGTLPGTITTICEAAFEFGKLKTITLPASLTTIENYALWGCASLETLDFSACAGLTTLPNQVIEKSAIKTLYLPPNLTSDLRVLGLANLEKLYIPANLSSVIEAGAFRGIPKVRFYVTGTGAYSASADGKMLLKTEGGETTLIAAHGVSGKAVIPEGVTIIGWGAFFEGAGISSVDFSQAAGTLKRVEYGAFSANSGLKELDFSSCVALEFLGGAGVQLDNLDTLKLPASLASIGEFQYLFGLKSVYIPADMPAAINGDTFFRCPDASFIISGGPGRYRTDNTGTILLREDAGGAVALVSGSAAKGVVTIPADVTVIERGAFFYNHNITGLELAPGSALVTIGESAVENTLITKLDLSNARGLKTLGRRALSVNHRLKWVKWPASAEGALIWGGVDTLEAAFDYCTHLEKVELPDNLAWVYDNAFDDKTTQEPGVTFVLNSPTPPVMGATNPLSNRASAIYVPDAALETYRNADSSAGWNAYKAKLKPFSELEDPPAAWN